MKLKIIKFISLFLAFIIIFGSIICMYLLFNMATAPKATVSKDINLEQPIGTSVKNVLINDGYLYITVSNINSSDKILVVDSKNNSLVSTISLN